MWVQSLDWEDPLEEEMAAHSCILAWRVPWTEGPDGLQSMGSQRVRHDCTHMHTHDILSLFLSFTFFFFLYPENTKWELEILRIK